MSLELFAACEASRTKMQPVLVSEAMLMHFMRSRELGLDRMI
jgi:hypothetical protein